MLGGKEWWQTVRFAIKEEDRTGRLIAILVAVVIGVVVITAAASGVSVQIG
ncbi:hypothetical protein SUDANB58_05790 (plasmid) [Streptomyces sp. enrichment culture]|uniref:hypothetical protein n=1 Tax=Streptomyces sp. enrichment culture TaxID=1795815 RepID=UPI003F569D1D